MTFGKSKRAFLGLAAGVVMTFGMVAPTLATTATSDSHDVTVSGTNNATLTFAITTAPSVSFGTVDPLGTEDTGNNVSLEQDFNGSGSCYRSVDTVDFLVQSNHTYHGEVTATAGAGNSISKLHWAHDADAGGSPNGPADCTSAAFVASADNGNWISGDSTPSDAYTDSYALHVDWTDEVAPDFTITYSVSQ
jgi:hypothetical protein